MGLFGMAGYGDASYGMEGGTDSIVTAGATIRGGSNLSIAAKVRLRVLPLTVSGDSRFSITYYGLPEGVVALPLVVSGNSNARINLTPVEQVVDGSLVVLTIPDKSTTERSQFGRAGLRIA